MPPFEGGRRDGDAVGAVRDGPRRGRVALQPAAAREHHPHADRAARTQFDRADLLLAMERLHAFYMSRYGLQRPQGLSIDGRPDFLGIAQWIFDIYLAARSGGFSAEGAFDIVIAAITQTDEWRRRTPDARRSRRASLPRGDQLQSRRVSRGAEPARSVLCGARGAAAARTDCRLRAVRIFSASRRGSSISTSTSGCAAAQPTAAWAITENAIRATDEWRRKH